MKKSLILVCVLVSFMTGCSNTYRNDPYSSFKKYTAETLFHNAQTSIRKERFSDAVEQLEAMDSMYPFGPYAQKSQLDIIYAYYKSDDATSTIVAADRYAHLYPRGPHVDYVYYMRGLANLKVGTSWLQQKLKVNLADRDTDSLREAFIAFTTLRREYPNSVYAMSAYHRAVTIRNMMAERYLHIAKYYEKNRAYVASTNRASEIVQHFNGTVFVPDALAVMVRSYRGLGLPTLAKHTLSVLAQSYPDSEAYHSFK